MCYRWFDGALRVMEAVELILGTICRWNVQRKVARDELESKQGS